MGIEKKLGMAVGAMMLGLGLGYWVFWSSISAPRSSTQAIFATRPVSLVSSVAATKRPAAKLPPQASLAAARAVRDAESDRDARLGEIDQQIRDLPEVDLSSVRALANEIKLRRVQVGELRSQVDELDLSLALNGSLAETTGDSQIHLAAQVAELQRKLAEAQASVREQRRKIGWIAASNDEKFMSSLNRELEQRKNTVSAIQREIRDLFETSQRDLDAEKARRRAKAESLLRNRNSLVEAYNESVAGLTDAGERYRQLLATISASQKEARELSAEKASLLQH